MFSHSSTANTNNTSMINNILNQNKSQFDTIQPQKQCFDTMHTSLFENSRNSQIETGAQRLQASMIPCPRRTIQSPYVNAKKNMERSKVREIAKNIRFKNHVDIKSMILETNNKTTINNILRQSKCRRKSKGIKCFAPQSEDYNFPNFMCNTSIST